METSDEEEFIDEEEAEIGPATVKRLREKLQKAVEEKQEYLDKWQRLQADFANFKRQEALIHIDREARITSDLIESLIPALDTFEIALKHEKDNASLAMIHKQLLQALKSNGVEKFGATGDTFDHYIHEALAQQGDGSNIISVERSGYRIGDKIIRPAQVII